MPVRPSKRRVSGGPSNLARPVKVGAVELNQNFRLRSERLGGETRFRPLSVGMTAGYYVHIGPNFYVYPTAAFTYNRVVSGSTAIRGTHYEVERLSPNASLHAGWEWGR